MTSNLNIFTRRQRESAKNLFYKRLDFLSCRVPLRPEAVTLSTALPQKQLAETCYFFPSPTEGGPKSLARPSSGMELQLGPNVTQIHLYKARSLRLGGADKHRIYTYIPLF